MVPLVYRVCTIEHLTVFGPVLTMYSGQSPDFAHIAI